MRENYPGLFSTACAAFSVFHGPAIESSFSVMGCILDVKRASTGVDTYSSIQTVKYDLRAKNKSSAQLYDRKNPQHSPINKPLCRAIRSSALRNKQRIHQAFQRKVNNKKISAKSTDKHLKSKCAFDLQKHLRKERRKRNME